MYKEQQNRPAGIEDSANGSEKAVNLAEEDLGKLNNLLFSLRKPKDLKAGIASGGKSVAKGLIGGTVTLFAAPAVGAVAEGWSGFAKGVGVGLAGAVVLPLTGIGIGVAQAVRGAINTPEAIREASKGRIWSQEHRRWIDVPHLALVLDDEAFLPIRQRWQADPANQASTSGDMASDNFYDLLGVAKTASPEQIKQRYYILARKMHPDKNPDDPSAKQRFQKLGEAYQVLGNAELRDRYDKHGSQALDVDFMDASEFFTMLFGSDKFEHLIGELTIAAAARSGGELRYAQMKKLQAARMEELSIMLKALLRRWVEGDQVGFKEATCLEAKLLANNFSGAKILDCLGRMYVLQADISLGGFLDSAVAGMKYQVHSLKTHMSAAGMAIKVFQAQQKMEKFELEAQVAQDGLQQPGRAPKSRKTNKDQDVHAQDSVKAKEQQALKLMNERKQLEEAALPLMLDALWAANVLDIEATVRGTCKKVLNDTSVDSGVRKLRGAALKAMGTIFQECAAAVLQQQIQPAKEERSKLAQQQLEEAMLRVTEKRNAMDDALYGTV